MQTRSNKGYWERRAEERVVASEKLVQLYEQSFGRQVDAAMGDIESQIAELYLRYAELNEMDLADAIQYLTANHRREFQRDLL